MSPEMEKSMKRLFETLIRGRNSAKTLENLLRRKVNSDGSVSVHDLMLTVVGSFSDGLSELNSWNFGDFSGVRASPQVGLGVGCFVDRPSEVYTGTKPAPAVKERRGCYKRRKTIDSRVKVSATTEDSHAWRKYGQKAIHNSKFPRCYFRCTHKTIHGCKALKQVQKLEDESNMFHITYFGHHTCPTPNTLSPSGVVLNFEDSKNHQYYPNSPSTITNIQIDPSVKQEGDSKVQSDDLSDNISSPNHAPALWKEMMIDDDLNACHGGDASFRGFDHEDSCASTSSHGYLDMEFFKNDGFYSDDQLNEMFF